jgi:hypothetical protein
MTSSRDHGEAFRCGEEREKSASSAFHRATEERASSAGIKSGRDANVDDADVARLDLVDGLAQRLVEPAAFIDTPDADGTLIASDSGDVRCGGV